MNLRVSMRVRDKRERKRDVRPLLARQGKGKKKNKEEEEEGNGQGKDAQTLTTSMRRRASRAPRRGASQQACPKNDHRLPKHERIPVRKTTSCHHVHNCLVSLLAEGAAT
jgi:hypothetical protein